MKYQQSIRETCKNCDDENNSNKNIRFNFNYKYKLDNKYYLQLLADLK